MEDSKLNSGAPEEEWRVIEEFPKYLVSNLGRIRNFKTGFILSGRANNSGYSSVGLFDNCGRKTISIHSLVARSFIGDRPEGLVINHIDGVKTNNKVENLEYVTCKRNTQHAWETGLIVFDDAFLERTRFAGRCSIAARNGGFGENNPMFGWVATPEFRQKMRDIVLSSGSTRGEKSGTAKLTAEAVLEIRKLGLSGEYTHSELAGIYGVSQSSISMIISRKRWKHL